MISSIGPLFFLLAVGFVALANPFGPARLGATSGVGLCVMATTGVALFFAHPPNWRVKVARPLGLVVVVVGGSAMIVAWMIYIVHVYGFSAAYLYAQGEMAPDAILHAQYRDLMPLKAWFCPLNIVLLVSSALVVTNGEALGWRRAVVMISGAVQALVTIAFVALYETRYILIWSLLYLVIIMYPTVKALIKRAMNGWLLGSCAH